VTEHADQLRDAFETHENQTPDPAAVFARVQELSRKYQRRRRGAQAAGGVALSAGLVAGVINLPGLLPGGGAQNTGTSYQAGAPSTTVATKPSAPSERTALDAYFEAGYDYDDAMRLAVLWKLKADPYAIKAEAGRRLLAGETLPFRATPNEDVTETPDPAMERQLQAYFAAGYDYADAVKLAKLWKLSDPSEAKALAGKKLLAHQKLPIKPKPGNVAAAKEAAQVNAFFEKGYDVDDAIKLAKLWKLKTAYDAKVLGGKKLLAGETLPIKP
jgi:hypothetical protein